ncbi:MAG: TetR family transcriptional regulator [Polyangiaceae bacterium]
MTQRSARRKLAKRASVFLRLRQRFSRRTGSIASRSLEIAKKARVSTASVYAQFNSKAGVLEALAHSVLLGPSYASMAEQIEASSDPEAALRVTAKLACGIYQREHREMGLIRGAAAYSPALKKLEATLETVRRDLQESTSPPRLYEDTGARRARPRKGS